MSQLSLHTPLGEVTLSEEGGEIVALDWGRGRDREETPALRRAADAVQDYFDGLRADFADLPLNPRGTAHQRKVWAALRRIPPGGTRCYLAIAREIGSVARAVGQANAANPIPILVPCHRVVSADGSLGGYSGGEGAATKRYLLDLEARATLRREGTKAG